MDGREEAVIVHHWLNGPAFAVLIISPLELYQG